MECGTETERFRGGACIRCVLEADLTTLLRPTEPPDLRLVRLIQALADVPRPESIYTWMRGPKAHELLTRIGTRELALTPEAFDALPRSTAVDHLREILIHNRLMVAPEDRHLAIFERWVNSRVTELQEHPDVALLIERYAKWHHLSRLRQRVGHTNMDVACRGARQNITEAGKFLTWLYTEQHVTTATFTQAHIDTYLDGAVTTRFHIKNFISWYARGRGGKGRLFVPARKAITSPILSQQNRLQVIRNAIEFDDVSLNIRIAALIHLLWATPLTRVAGLTKQHIELRPDGMYIHLGATPSLVPEFIAPLFWAHVHHTDNEQTTNAGTEWLFPGYRAGRPIAVPTLQQRFHALGLDPQRTRNSTLKHLTAQLDVHTLADTLGYSAKTLSQHAERAGAYFGHYVDAKRAATASRR